MLAEYPFGCDRANYEEVLVWVVLVQNNLPLADYLHVNVCADAAVLELGALQGYRPATTT